MHDENYYAAKIKTLGRIVKMVSKPKILNLDRIPATGSAIIVANHISNIDPVILGTLLAPRRQVQALAKAGLFNIPVVGSMLTRMGHIPVHRGTEAAWDSITAAEKIVGAGGVVAIYPEGTVPKGEPGKLGSFKSGAALLAEASGVPVIPIGQVGADEVLPRGKNPIFSIVRSLFKKPSAVFAVGEPIFFEDYVTVERFNEELVVRIEALKLQALAASRR